MPRRPPASRADPRERPDPSEAPAALAPVNRLTLAVSSVAGGLSAALMPVLAALLLPVSDYGAFSLIYLVFAEGWSIQLSAVCDTWARKRAASRSAGTWPDYAAALATISAITAAVTLLVGSLVLGSVPAATLMAVAVGATLYRQGARYHHAVVHGPQSVLLSDLVAVSLLVAVTVGTYASGRSMLISLLVAWAVSSVASAAFFVPNALGGQGPRAWYRRNDRTVRTLMGESLLMDAGATGGPVLVAPFLGLGDFGVYRSVSSLYVPIQLLLDAVRPYVSQVRLSRVTSLPVVGGLLLTAGALGATGYVVLTTVVPAVLSFSPVLVALGDVALPCALFLAFQFLTHVCNILVRIHVSHRRLIVGRAVHTVFAVTLPVAGAITGSLTGAVWCFVATTVLTVLIWGTLLAGVAREPRADAPAQQTLPPAGPD